MRRFHLIALAVGALVATSGQQAAAAGDGKISFTRYVNVDVNGQLTRIAQLTLMDPDGTNLAAFDPTPVQGGPAAWSPDGTKIAYNRLDPNDAAHSGLVVATADGSSITKIGVGGSPSWSPDGSRIAFNCTSRSICVVNADGTGLQTPLAGGPADINPYPTWSPDGTRIAFAHNITFASGLFTRQIYVMDADGSNPHNISSSLSWEDQPTWGPDGRIAFISARDGLGYYKIYVMNPDGSNVQPISAETASEYSPAWSSDGSKIAFSSDRQTPGCDLDCTLEIYTMSSTGQNVTRLTFDNDYDNYPAWKPSGAVVDVKPPDVQCLGGAVGWTATNVVVACTASDDGSGLADLADASFQLSTSVAVGAEDAAAMTSSRNVCDLATPQNCAFAQRGPFMVDRKPPTISLTTPALNDAFVLAQPVAASFVCADGGAGVASCTGTVVSGSPIDTASVGTKSFVVTASDSVGNAAPPASRTYTVSFAVRVLGSNHNVSLRLVDWAGIDRGSASTTLTIGTIDGIAISNQVFTLQNNGSYRWTPPAGFDRGPHTLTFTATGDPVPHSVPFKY